MHLFSLHKARYADNRRTQIVSGDHKEITSETLLPDEMVWVSLTQDGLLARTTSDEHPPLVHIRLPAPVLVCQILRIYY